MAADQADKQYRCRHCGWQGDYPNPHNRFDNGMHGDTCHKPRWKTVNRSESKPLLHDKDKLTETLTVKRIVDRLHERQKILDDRVSLHKYPSYAKLAQEIESGTLFTNDFQSE